MKKLCSIIVRTQNEERWISSFLKSIYNQTYKNFEVIIVDNNSTDSTLGKAKAFPIDKILSIKKYLPGKALNRGIESSKGDYIVCISAHCIPVDENWLLNLVKAIEEDDSYAGVYGRQQPMSFSHPADKRDLLIAFGLDRKIQIKDSFFHNANSIIKKSLWEKFPFDSNATNIEDRIWAQEMIDSDYKILYEPDASVYHYHGIHQEGNVKRLSGVINIIESMNLDSKPGQFNIDSLNIVAIIPISRLRDNNNKSKLLINDRQQFSYTIESAKESKYIKKIIVSTDSESVIKDATELGAECPFIRPKELSESFITNDDVQKYSLNKLEELGEFPDIVVHLEETFPFREKGLIDQMIKDLLHHGYDSVLAARAETGFIWKEDNDGNYSRLGDGDIPRSIKEKSFIGLRGLCCVTLPNFIRNGNILGNNIGLHKIESSISGFEVRDETSRKIIGSILNENL